jgi:hypothetical protein
MTERIARRVVLGKLGAIIAVAPLLEWLGCGGDNATSGGVGSDAGAEGGASADAATTDGGDTANENVGFCTGNDSDYVSHLYFRGKQTTDADGIVTFDTCFPGWYSSRTVHVHFTMTVGSTSFTSQFVFDDALDDEIIGAQPIYSARGKRDTTNTTDTVVSASTSAQFQFETQKMSDGALLAWKSIVLSA